MDGEGVTRLTTTPLREGSTCTSPTILEDRNGESGLCIGMAIGAMPNIVEHTTPLGIVVGIIGDMRGRECFKRAERL